LKIVLDNVLITRILSVFLAGLEKCFF
jgi:hypothetical protein